jgi:hypothetical protein
LAQKNPQMPWRIPLEVKWWAIIKTTWHSIAKLPCHNPTSGLIIARRNTIQKIILNKGAPPRLRGAMEISLPSKTNHPCVRMKMQRRRDTSQVEGKGAQRAVMHLKSHIKSRFVISIMWGATISKLKYWESSLRDSKTP